MNFNKHFYTLALILLLISCKEEPKKISFARISRDVPTIKTVTYPDGKIRSLITYYKASVSAIEYFNHTGKWDSISYYKKGQRSSVTRFTYYSDGSSERNTFINDTFSLKQKFDKSHNLVYKEPIDTRHLSKIVWKLNSGRSMVDVNKVDTIIILSKDLPPQNRGYKFIGFKPRALQNLFPTAYVISPFQPVKSLIQLSVYVYLHEKNEHKQLVDSFIIPIKR